MSKREIREKIRSAIRTANVGLVMDPESVKLIDLVDQLKSLLRDLKRLTDAEAELALAAILNL